MKKRSLATKVSAGLMLAGLTVAGTAFADWQTYTPTQVGCFDNGNCYIVVSPSVPAAHSSCATKNQVRFQLSVAGGVEMYRTALAAKLAGRTLDINVYSAACVDGYPKALYLNVN